MSLDETAKTPSSPAELKVGMELPGKVKSVELYGAFVDIGVGQDALLHISQLGKPNVRNVEDVVKIGEEITVYVLKIHKETGRVALSLEAPPSVNWDDIREGETLTGTVVRVEKFGLFVDIGAERPGMVHVSELAEGFVKSPSDIANVGDEVEVRVIRINRKKRQIDLSMKPEIEPIEAMDDDEEDEDVPTAMAFAFRRAMEASETDEPEVAKPKTTAKQKRQEQEEILSRTLRQHSSS
jgi:small subunit ribosomal protein S1